MRKLVTKLVVDPDIWWMEFDYESQELYSDGSDGETFTPKLRTDEARKQSEYYKKVFGTKLVTTYE